MNLNTLISNKKLTVKCTCFKQGSTTSNFHALTFLIHCKNQWEINLEK